MSKDPISLSLTVLIGVVLSASEIRGQGIEAGPVAADRETSPKTGEALARVYCQTCHLFPEPALLDKKTWQSGALIQMAPWLGVARLNLESRPDGALLKEAGLFPPSPIISRDDWMAVCRYFIENAPSEPLPQGPRPPIHPLLPGFKVRTVLGRPGPATTCLIRIDPESTSLFLGEATPGRLSRLDPTGRVEQQFELSSGPVSLARHGQEFYSTLIGRILPSDEPVGELVRFRFETDSGPRIESLLSGLQRPTGVAWADFNRDGRDDFVLCQFGHRLGRLSWFEGKGNERWEEQELLPRPGAVRAVVHDLNGDGWDDIVVLMAQALEGIYLFANQGDGRFEERILIQQHPLFGYSHFELLDFNRDGHLDLLTTNGDNGEYPSPPKNYHGIRLYLNDGHAQFRQEWFFPLNGAFKAMAADFDGDGDLDIAAISFFPDYTRSPEESFVFLEQRTEMEFAPYTFPEHLAGRWLTMDAGDLDGDGDTDIVLGSFAAGPLSIPIPAEIQNAWQRNRLRAVILENIRHQ